MKVTAYIPCFNNEGTLGESIGSVLHQTIKPDEVIVVDDGSTDRSAEMAQSYPVKVLRHARNLGRGAARAAAVEEASHNLILGCDATVVLPERFIELTLPYFQEPAVAAVCGHFIERESDTTVKRWRARHLYKQDAERKVAHGASLITAGAIQRRDYVLAAGNYNKQLRHSEDDDLGARLLAAGYDIVSDPRLEIECLQNDTLGRLLERYWRWYAGAQERVDFRGYIRNIWYAIRVMAWDDLRQGDAAAALISLLMPHNQFWRSIIRRWSRERQRARVSEEVVANSIP